ncbi:MAG TPA: hypothetical protein VMT53_23155 [Terriglobales bacterium]|nr:hypothetical protein [Terriglobales bacterium]
MEFTRASEEHQYLVDILEQRQRELRREISHTDHKVFKLALRKDEKLLESVLTRLRLTPVEDLSA